MQDAEAAILVVAIQHLCSAKFQQKVNDSD